MQLLMLACVCFGISGKVWTRHVLPQAFRERCLLGKRPLKPFHSLGSSDHLQPRAEYFWWLTEQVGWRQRG